MSSKKEDLHIQLQDSVRKLEWIDGKADVKI